MHAVIIIQQSICVNLSIEIKNMLASYIDINNSLTLSLMRIFNNKLKLVPASIPFQIARMIILIVREIYIASYMSQY